LNDATKIFLTACATIGGGAILFCATTLVNKLVFEPVIAVRKALGDISYCLQYNAWVLHTTDVPKERFEKVFDDLRSFTARLRADANAIMGYSFFSTVRWIPKYDDLIEGCGRLIRISNLLGREKWDQMDEDLKTVESLLGIDIGRPKYEKT
jgi:hypothetical protein